MRSILPRLHLPRLSLLLSALPLLACLPALAQGVRPGEALQGPANQTIERITHEDAGSRIDEVRYGGQTESITVQPKSGLPAYQIDPGANSRGRPANRQEEAGGTGGQRTWNLKRF